LSYEKVICALERLGLSGPEALIYVYLEAKGPNVIEDIERELPIEELQLRLSLENLKKKKIVNSTVKHTSIFQALPFEKALELLVQANMITTRNIEQNRAKILSKWETIIQDDKSTNPSPRKDKTAC